MPFSVFYQKKNKSSRLFGAANFLVALSLVLNLSFPYLALAQANNKTAQAQTLPLPLSASFYNPPYTHYLQAAPSPRPKPKVKRSFYILVTAYSSTVSQCDSTPFITANGTRVHDGIVAANFLPFGTKLRLPSYSGEKIYTVEDRMHPRFRRRIDIWMPTTQAAKEFGVKWLKVEILE